MPSATSIQVGWMDWPCPYKRISKFNKPVTETFEPEEPMPDAEDHGNKTDNAALKKHAACDECRTRKLKCSGEESGCTRCVKQSLVCHYSVQKQMGRPRKRRREEESAMDPISEKLSSTSPIVHSMPLPIQPYNALDNTGLMSFANYSPATPGPLTPLPINGLNPFDGSNNFGHDTGSFSDPPSLSAVLYTPPSNNNSTPPDDDFVNPILNQSWPEFSSIISPYPVHPTIPSFRHNTDGQSPTLSSSNPNPLESTQQPQCSCLPTLYLTLASLQTHIPTFPDSLIPLRAATSTALSVLRCPTCPLSFPTALQNVMLLGTLLPVILSSYARLLASISDHASIPANQRTIITGDTPAALTTDDSMLYGYMGAEHPWGTPVEIPAEKWAELCRKAVRREVYGSEDKTKVPGPNDATAGVMGLVNEMEARQHRWHECLAEGHGGIGAVHGIDPNIFKNQCNLAESKDKVNERDALCLKIVGGVRKIVISLAL